MHPPEQADNAGGAATRLPAGDLLEGLNPAQRKAVVHPGGPVLVLAGAGSGKTRVIAHRIAHLIRDRNVPSAGIFAVTFTNKAADEMLRRVESLLNQPFQGGWIGTFHALCARILRAHGDRIGLAPGFNIYDSADQLALLRRILREEHDDDTPSGARSILSRISRAKNALEGPEDLERRAVSPEARRAARVFPLYNLALRRANAVDFDDLLVRTLDLFREDPSVEQWYAERCVHLLVDEYQDTNRPQYLLVRRLSSGHGNVFVVGDEDQSIYRFRGADIRNILEFEKDHPGAAVVKLEQNYRSTGTILRAAGAVISRNRSRKGKALWTENVEGDKVELFHAPDDRLEAAWVAARVRELEGEVGFGGMAVLYRTNAQSRQIEEIFRRDRVPYQVVGSVQFYERREVKDVLAYLQLAVNPDDDVAFRRVVNTPARGIGAATLRVISDVARAHRIPEMRAAVHALEQSLLPARTAAMLRRFLDLVADLARRSAEEPVPQLLSRLVGTLEYEAYLEKTYPGQGSERMDNVRALISAAVEYCEEEDGADVPGFLDRSALVSDADQIRPGAGVTLMTVHCAKGLEFPVVFLVGMEENLFPHARSVAGSREDVEEERRLCYVAMTRAKRRLLLSHAGLRRTQGLLLPGRPSRFLGEIPPEVIRAVDGGAESLLLEGEGFGGDRSTAVGSSAARAARRKRRASPIPAAPSGAVPADGFGVGLAVRHPMFGPGRILRREGAGKGLKLTIQFLRHGRKKILPAYTQLRVEDPSAAHGPAAGDAPGDGREHGGR